MVLAEISHDDDAALAGIDLIEVHTQIQGGLLWTGGLLLHETSFPLKSDEPE